MEVNLPKLGESILNAKIVQWFKKEGDAVELDEPLLEVSTDKVNSEIPAPASGVLQKILVQVDEEVDVGAPLCILSEEGSAIEKEKAPRLQQETTSQEESMEHYYSPAVMRIASEKNLSIDDLKKIKGTGAGKRVTKKDIENYTPSEKKDCSGQRIKMTGIRKAIAESMVRSFYQAPHASFLTEIDITEVQKLIKQEKEAFFQEHGVKLSITAFIARALAKALKEYPYLNASIEEDTIVLKPSVNIGIAVSVENGIMVPVIHGCENKSLLQIASEIAKLSEKARSKTLKPDDVQGGTITMTNFGMSGVKAGIPIIHHPEVAILGVGAIERKVVAMDDDSIKIRTHIHITLTFDHRIIDGMYGCRFLNAFEKHLEKDLEID
ncbi:MAG: dihydrolipoamide acetyltransferase family protein [Simkaniaceae bacterium]